MIRLRQGRTKKSRFLKTALLGIILALTVLSIGWVLQQFKEEDQSWSEFFLYVFQRLTD